MVSIAAAPNVPGISSHRLVRGLFFALGGLLVATGILGIFLPLLPSTVFFLMAAPCFSKSSPAAHRWLTTNRLFGRQLANYQDERGATNATKFVTLASLWVGIGLAGWSTGFNPWISLALFVIAAGVSAHIWRLRTIRS
jgi:uncharacterized membrane protein YbaN (DUF454 family)